MLQKKNPQTCLTSDASHGTAMLGVLAPMHFLSDTGGRKSRDDLNHDTCLAGI